jgi:hypothetical protein
VHQPPKKQISNKCPEEKINSRADSERDKRRKHIAQVFDELLRPIAVYYCRDKRAEKRSIAVSK